MDAERPKHQAVVAVGPLQQAVLEAHVARLMMAYPAESHHVCQIQVYSYYQVVVKLEVVQVA